MNVCVSLCVFVFFLMTNGKTIGGYATFAERGPRNSSKKCRSCGIRKSCGTTWKTSVPVVNSVPGPAANSQCAQSPSVHAGAGDTGDPDVTMEDSIRDVNKATQEIKVMQDMHRAIPPGELDDVKANIEAKIAAATKRYPFVQTSSGTAFCMYRSP